MQHRNNLIKRNLAKLIPTPHKSRISCVNACNSTILMSQSPNPGTEILVVRHRSKWANRVG